MKKIKIISFKTKLILTLELLVIIILTTLGILTYNIRQSLIRQVSETKLLAIASSTAAVIDSEKLSSVQTEVDTTGDSYREIRQTLKKIKTANPGIDDVYLMKKTVYKNILKFIVSASDAEDKNGNGSIEENEQGAFFEEEYEISAFPEMANVFNNVVTTDKKISCDKWGCWLSGYAPIIDKNGAVIAIVGVDIPGEEIISYEKEMRKALLEILGTIFILFPLFLFFYLQYILRPISKITKSISEFGGNLKTRINLNRDDEFGLIAKTFNQMALDLEILYTQMEKRVDYKTKELAEIAKRALEEKAKEEAFLDSVGEGMIAIDKEGKVIMANKQAENILGKLSENMLGKRTDEIYNVEDEFGKKLLKGERPLQKALFEKRKISGKYYCVHAVSKIPVFITASPVICSDEILGAILVFRDITRENEIDKAKTEFVSLASHQLRTPLSIISWHSEALSEDREGFSEKQKTYLEKISHATKRMVDLVRALLNTTRLEMGTFSIDEKEVDLVKLAEDILEDIKPLSLIQNISLEKKFSDKAIIFKGDPQLLAMIFQNLLANAIKYSKRDGKVFLEVIKKSPNIIIKVADQGIGITEKQKAEIFTRFFRADNAKEKDAEGTGLGLYIIKTIVENLSGTIFFDSAENKGTTFTITLPEVGMPKKEGTRKLI
jgi:PAS domain S-box-containing protein